MVFRLTEANLETITHKAPEDKFKKCLQDQKISKQYNFLLANLDLPFSNTAGAYVLGTTLAVIYSTDLALK